MAKDRGIDSRSDEERLEEFCSKLDRLTTTHLADIQEGIASGNGLLNNARAETETFGNVATVPAVTYVLIEALLLGPQTQEVMGEQTLAFRDSSVQVLQVMAVLSRLATDPKDVGSKIERYNNRLKTAVERVTQRDGKLPYVLARDAKTLDTYTRLFHQVSPIVERAMGGK